jgi:predicted ABC-type ATPase
MMGGQGAGKSTLLNGLIEDKGEFVHVSADDVKEALPEYQSALKGGNANAATTVHQESKQVAKSLAGKAMANRNNLVYDATGATRKDYDDLIDKLKVAGYKVSLVMVHITVEEGLRRIGARAQQTGRNVEEKYARAAYPLIGPNFAALVPKADDALLFDNMAGQPKLVWSKAAQDTGALRQLLGIGG